MSTSNLSIKTGLKMIRESKNSMATPRDEYGLGVYVIRNPLGDSTNNGLSSRITNLILVDGRGSQRRNLDACRVIEPDADYLVLLDMKFQGKTYLRAVPKSILDSDKHPMFGGNFIYSSDSRFPSDQPIKIHDRVEG